MTGGLRRQLGLPGSVAIGLSSMIGAGVFVVFAPAAEAAGDGLYVALSVAALIALCNAMSSARLASIYPESGGTYVYGRERLGPFWGYLAGSSFIVGKIASCAAMALAIGAYAWPHHAHGVAVVAVLSVTVINYAGVQKSAVAAFVIVGITLVVLVTVVVATLVGPASDTADSLTATPDGVIQAAGLLFFAFAGYARLATLGEEVRNPRSTIPRAIGTSLAITVALYALLAFALQRTLGIAGLAVASAPLTDAAQTAGASGIEPAVRTAAVIASLGSLLSLLLGVSRTVLAMARDRHLPRALDAIHPRFAVPHRAEIAIGIIVAALAATLDLRNAIGFSSFAVLIYYSIANASAWTLDRNWQSRVIPALGIVGCLTLAFALPPTSVVSGTGILLVAAIIWRIRRPLRDPQSKERTP
ncbi:MAG: APC family permease [Aeromicrobium sp.]